MAIIKSYSICDVDLKFHFEDEELYKRLNDEINYYIFANENRPWVLGDIILRFKNKDSSINIPEEAKELSVSSSLRVLKDGDFCYLISGDSVIRLDLENSSGFGQIDAGFWKSPLKYRQDFLMLSLLWLIRPHGLYTLHANGLAKDEVGLLIVGNSGSGKSTTALSLIKQGWKYLSDDVLLIRERPQGVEAIAFQRGFSFDPKLANSFPELSCHLEKASFNGNKRFLNMESIYADSFQSSCFPKVLIFPGIVSQDRSELIPIDRAEALILLAGSSGGIMVDKEMVEKQMGVLKRLVYQTTVYRLLAGRDLCEEPERISEVLAGVGV
jgi:hypothetical protein